MAGKKDAVEHIRRHEKLYYLINRGIDTQDNISGST